MLRTVASDSCRARDAAQVVLHERHVRAAHRDIGSRSHRDADVRARKRRHVVDPVARRRDAASFLLQLRHEIRLVLRAHFNRSSRYDRLPGHCQFLISGMSSPCRRM
jgi:hypothetical protein